MNSKKRSIKNLVIFILIVLASGWIGRGLDVLMDQPSNESLGMLLWLLLPFIASISLLVFTREGFKNFGLRPNIKHHIPCYLIAILAFPVVTSLIMVIGYFTNWIDFSKFTFALFLPAFFGALIPGFLKNIFEEFAWRGYLSPKVDSFKINDFLLYLIVGLVWGAWHIPYYLYFLSREEYQSFTSLNLGVFIPLSIIIMIIWSIEFVELRKLTNSTWPLVIMHMIEDAFNLLFIGGYVLITVGKEMLLHPVFGLFGILLHAIIGLSLRYIRKKKELNFKH